MRALAIGGCALETRVRNASAGARGVYREQQAASIFDRPGGSGWFLSLGASICGAQAELLCNLANDSAGAQIRAIAGECGVALKDRIVGSTPRFVLLLNASDEHFRFAPRSKDLVVPTFLEDYDVICVGFVGNSTLEKILRALVEGRARARRKPFVIYAPSNSLEFLDIELLRNFLALVDLMSFTAREGGLARQRFDLDSIGISYLIETDRSFPMRCHQAEGLRQFLIQPHTNDAKRTDYIGAGDLTASVAGILLANGVPFDEAVNRAMLVVTESSRYDDPVRKRALGIESLKKTTGAPARS